MRKVILTSSGIRQLQSRRRFRDGVGYTIELQYKGTQLECGQALEALVAAGVVREGSIDPVEGGMYQLVVDMSARNATTDEGGTPISGPESVVTTWSRQTSSIEKSLWELQKMRDVIALYPTEELQAQFRTTLEKYFRGDLSQEEYDTWININFEERNPTTEQRNNLKKLLEMFAKGVESYRLDAFIIQRTQVGAPESLINNDATNNRIWTRATLIADATMPAAFKASVPTGYFLQYAAELNVLDNAKWQVTQLWQWSESYESWIWGEPI